MKTKGGVHGILVVDKPKGPTSHDVVQKLRRVFGTRRIGHAGTLDPMATGVLVILLGEATKLSNVLTRESKEYEAVVEFGRATESYDAEGKTTRVKELAPGWLEREALGRALEGELERELQVPPPVSAIKVDGKRAYARARAGEELELAPREVTVHGLELLETGERHVRVRLAVSKGYYVRSFARDLGSSLGVPAHLRELCRTRSGAFVLADALGWPPAADAPLLSLEAAVRRSLPAVDLTPEGALRAAQGKLLRPEDLDSAPPPTHEEGRTVAAFAGGRFVALLEELEVPGHFRVQRGVASDFAASSAGSQADQ